jgi:hypothetical protein
MKDGLLPSTCEKCGLDHPVKTQLRQSTSNFSS